MIVVTGYRLCLVLMLSGMVPSLHLTFRVGASASRRCDSGGRATFHGNCDIVWPPTKRKSCLLKVRSFFVCKDSCMLVDELAREKS